MLFEPEVNEIAAHRRSVVRHHVMIVEALAPRSLRKNGKDDLA